MNYLRSFCNVSDVFLQNSSNAFLKSECLVCVISSKTSLHWKKIQARSFLQNIKHKHAVARNLRKKVYIRTLYTPIGPSTPRPWDPPRPDLGTHFNLKTPFGEGYIRPVIKSSQRCTVCLVLKLPLPFGHPSSLA